jgi:hypothetical protein
MKSFAFVILIVATVAGCNQRDSNSNQRSNPAGGPDTIAQTKDHDSLEIVSLLKDVYRWHNKNQNRVDFLVIVREIVKGLASF